MEQHIEKLLKFINENDCTIELNRLSLIDKEIKELWEIAKSNQEFRKIKSAKDVEFLIKHFENCVMTSPTDIKARNACKYEMFIAQYKALRGLKVWCDRINVISSQRDTNFPDLTEIDVNRLICYLEKIIKKI